MQKSNISNKVHPQSHGLPQLTETGPPLPSRKSRSLVPRQQPNPDRPTVLRPSKQLTTRSSPSWGERPPPLCGSPQHLRTLIGRLERRGQARCAPGTSGYASCLAPKSRFKVSRSGSRGWCAAERGLTGFGFWSRGQQRGAEVSLGWCAGSCFGRWAASDPRASVSVALAGRFSVSS